LSRWAQYPHPTVCSRAQPVCRNGHRNSRDIAASFDAHHPTSAPQEYRLARVDVFEHEGKLDGLPEGEDAISLEENSTGTEVTCDTRPLRQLHT
jgi:hypothetical protein